MSLITVHLGMVKPHGTNDVPAVASGRVEFTPTTHGKYAGAFRTIETVNANITQGDMDPVELTPGAWNVTVYPLGSIAWPTYTFLLTEDLPEPVNIVDLAPEIVINGQSFAKGDQGPVGPGITGGYPNEDGSIYLVLENGSEVGPIDLPEGPSGPQGPQGVEGPRGIQGVQGPVGPAGMEWRGAWDPSIDYVNDDAVFYEGSSYFAAGDPTPGEVPDNTSEHWNALAIQGVQGPEGPQGIQGPEGPQGIRGEIGHEGPQGIQGERGIQGIQGPTGLKGDPGNLGTTLIYGAGRPDIPATMAPETATTVSSAPSGAQFFSSDGAGVGAWTWQKQGTKWVVTVGDTGWRSIPITERGSESLPDDRSYTKIRRSGNNVQASGFIYTPDAIWVTAGEIPSGFKSDLVLGASGSVAWSFMYNGNGDTAITAGVMSYTAWGTHRIRGKSIAGATNGRMFQLSWLVGPVEPWPTTLPGDPA